MHTFLLWTVILTGSPLLAFAAARWSLEQLS